MRIEFSDTWNFVEKYLPDYYHNEDVALVDRCYRYLNKDERAEMEQADIDEIEGMFTAEPTADDVRTFISDKEKELFLKACEHIYKLASEGKEIE